jgi:hypothetical protein
MPRLVIPALATRMAPIKVEPREIIVPEGPLPLAQSRTVSVRNLLAEPLTLSEPAVNAPNVEVRMQELKAGQYFVLKLELPQGFDAPGGRPVELKVKSNHPRYPVITVPIQPRRSVAGLDLPTQPADPDQVSARIAPGATVR